MLRLAVVPQEDAGEAKVFVVTDAMSATTLDERGSLRLWLETAAYSNTSSTAHPTRTTNKRAGASAPTTRPRLRLQLGIRSGRQFDNTPQPACPRRQHACS